MISVSILTVWWTLGFNYILYLAGLQDMPKDVYDAAALDGASTWNQMWHITIPLLNKTTALVLALQIVASLKIFDQIYLLRREGRTSRPDPRWSTSTTSASPTSGPATRLLRR